ncbi:hypothetical protein HPP92_020349 [Vanilla planifolia]|uniref:protein-serine/threonine phosphatase n=1 Tax=Vanilla planifolia TaxID=51239 RepID=A0A835Q4X2_VANPL|nr:hypothetical protein HPP92_020349 [Vanilla planifolia]
MEFGIFSAKLRASLGIVILLIVPSFSRRHAQLLVGLQGRRRPGSLQSPKMPSVDASADAPRDTSTNCQIAILQGRRRFLEDRAVCALDVRIPFLGRRGIKETVVGIVAVFDGHNGEEASDLASKLLLDYFLLHVNFLRDGIYSAAIKKSPEKLTYNEEQDALIEVTRFDNEESWQKLGDKSYDAGSTATVSLIADGRILTANVGDSKSFLCSEKFESLPENGIRSRLSKRRRHNGAVSKRFELANYGGLRYYAKDLLKIIILLGRMKRDRVEAAGGHIVEWAGVHRVNGQLALSRAIVTSNLFGKDEAKIEPLGNDVKDGRGSFDKQS